LKKFLKVMLRKFLSPAKTVMVLMTVAVLLASCSSVRYGYYTKHKVPYTAPEPVKYAKAIPVKPFITGTETALRSVPEQKKNTAPERAVAKNSERKTNAEKSEVQKVAGSLDINKILREQANKIKVRGESGNIDDRTMIIILLVILLLVVLALVGDGLLWLLWLALVILLILALIKYLGLFS
jgi:hypothetical protein